MLKNKFIYGTKEEFLKEIHDMRETDIDSDTYISHDGLTLVDLYSKDNDTYKWLKKTITEGKNINNAGYQLINTRHGVKLVHRLVAMAWVENPYKLKNVSHKDLNKTHNCASNLFWSEPKITMQHYFTHNTTKRTNVYKGRYSKKTSTFTDSNGVKTKMTPEEYIQYRKENGLRVTKSMQQ